MKLIEIAKIIDASIIGDKNSEIKCISTINNPINNSVIYISKLKDFSYLANLHLSVTLLVAQDHKALSSKHNLLISSNPRLSFAKLTKIFKKIQVENTLNSKPLHGSNFKLGENCTFGNNVVIGNNVSIGSNTYIGHNVVINDDVHIGKNVFIDSGSIIGSEGFGNVLSDTHEWEHIYHLGYVKISDNVSIGSNCCIDRGTIEKTVIGKGVIIDNSVHIAHNVYIGDHTAIAAKVGIAGSCIIGKRNLIGGMTGIVDHIVTCDDVTISATSTIISNINKPGVYSGIMPTLEHNAWKRVATLITKLDKISALFKKNRK